MHKCSKQFQFQCQCRRQPGGGGGGDSNSALEAAVRRNYEALEKSHESAQQRMQRLSSKMEAYSQQAQAKAKAKAKAKADANANANPNHQANATPGGMGTTDIVTRPSDRWVWMFTVWDGWHVVCQKL